MLKLKSLVYIPLFLSYLVAFSVYVPGIGIRAVFYFAIYPFLLYFLCFRFKDLCKRLFLITKYTSFKYLLLVLFFMIANSFLLCVFGKISIKQCIMPYILVLLVGITVIYVFYFYIIDKYISYRKFINIFILFYWIFLISGIICWLGQYFDIEFINKFYNFMTNSRIMKYSMNSLAVEKASNYVAFGLPRLAHTAEEPGRYAQYLFLFFPMVYAVASKQMLSFKSKRLNYIIEKTIVPMNWINVILTLSPIYLVFSIGITVVYYLKKMLYLLKKYFAYVFVVFCISILVVLLNTVISVDVSQTFLSRILKVLMVRSIEDLISADASLATRVISYINIFCVFLQHPINGCGFGNVANYMYDQLVNSPVPLTYEILSKNMMLLYTDSAFFNGNLFTVFLAENGLIGGSFVLLFIVNLYREIYTVLKYIGKSCLEYKVLKISRYILGSIITISFYNLTLTNRTLHIILAVIIFTIYRVKSNYKRYAKIYSTQKEMSLEKCLSYNKEEDINKE